MNKTRKIFSVLLLCAVMLFVTACGSKDDTPYSHGSWSGNTYTSDFLGIKLQLEGDWKITSDADLAKAFGIADMSAGSVQAIFDKNGTITEMMAGRSDGTSVNITITDITGLGELSKDKYFETATDLVKKQFESMGIPCNTQRSSAMFLGKNSDCIELTVDVNGQTLYELQVPIFKTRYTASITFASYSKSEIYSLLAMASAI